MENETDKRNLMAGVTVLLAVLVYGPDMEQAKKNNDKDAMNELTMKIGEFVLAALDL